MPGCDSARISSLGDGAIAKHSLARHIIAGSLARSLRLQRRRTISWIFNQRFISATNFHASGMSGRRSQTTGHFVPAVSQRRTQGLMGARIRRSLFGCGISRAAKKRKAHV
jgi:hypothetical protein